MPSLLRRKPTGCRLVNHSAAKAPPSTASNRYIAYTTYLQAALNDDGVGLGLSVYIDDMLRANRLCLASNRRVKSERGFFCWISDRGLYKPAARDFPNWLPSAIELKPR